MKRSSSGAMNEAKKSKDTDLFGRPIKKLGTWDSKDNGDLMIFTYDGMEGREKIAGFDMDGTLIKTKSGKVFPVNTDDWQLLYENIPSVLQDLHSEGYKIVIFTNQKGIAVGKVDRNAFRKKIEAIVARLKVPVQAYVSVAGGVYRKPCIGMWDELKKRNDNVEIDVKSSVYVGDAAGRHKTKDRTKKDHSYADRFFAENVGLKFKTPEQFFQKCTVEEPWGPPSFEPKQLFVDGIPRLEPEGAKMKGEGQEIIVMVGFPGSGKSMLARELAEQHGYKLVNRDVMGSWQKCVAATKSILKRGESVVVDNTSPDVESRKRYLEVAEEHGVPARCFWMQCSLEHAEHNCRFRVLTDESAQPIGSMVLRIHKSKFVEPTVAEGFKEIVRVNFRPKFHVAEHEDLYKMHLIDP